MIFCWLALAVTVVAARGLSAAPVSGLRSSGVKQSAPASGLPVRADGARVFSGHSPTSHSARAGIDFSRGAGFKYASSAAKKRPPIGIHVTSPGIPFSDAAIADAIRIAECRTSGVLRYGIRTARSEAAARRTCLATIKANRRRWIASGAPGEFVDFLGDRYCPRECDSVGNRNWKRNVKLILKKQ